MGSSVVEQKSENFWSVVQIHSQAIIKISLLGGMVDTTDLKSVFFLKVLVQVQ
jgi:hypothetical protein